MIGVPGRSCPPLALRTRDPAAPEPISGGPMHSAHVRLAVFLGWTLIGAGCTDEFTGPGTGSIQVALTTTGDDLDPDGYSLVFGEGRQFSLGLNSSIPITELAAGQYTLRLERLAS